jgi:hypothetical protein
MQTPHHQLVELMVISKGVSLSFDVNTLTRCAQRLKLMAPVLQLQLALTVDAAPLLTALQHEPLAVRRLAALLAAVDASEVQQTALCLDQLQLRQLSGAEQDDTVELSRRETLQLAFWRCYQAAPSVVVHGAKLQGFPAVALVTLRRSVAPLNMRFGIWMARHRVLECVTGAAAGLLALMVAGRQVSARLQGKRGETGRLRGKRGDPLSKTA